MVVPPSQNCILLRELKFDYDTSSWNINLLLNPNHNTCTVSRFYMSQPHFGQVWGWSPTLGKVGGLESSGTPECLELDSKAQNTLHWGVHGVIGKVLKHRYRKWPRIGHSDIFSPSYGQKKGRESLAVWLPTTKSRESTSSRRGLEECDTTLESSRWELQHWFRIRPIRVRNEELWPFKVLGVQPGHFRDSISGVPTKCAIRMWPPWPAAENTIWGKVVVSPESGLWWVLCVQVPVASRDTQGCFEC